MSTTPCPDLAPHDAHRWRPDGKRLTWNTPADRVAECPGVTAEAATVEEAVRSDLRRLEAEGRLHPDQSLRQLALTLARKLDNGAGSMTSHVARELRATIEALQIEPTHDDDDLVARLSAPVVNPPNGPADTRPRSR